jgi:hypothetical protein
VHARSTLRVEQRRGDGGEGLALAGQHLYRPAVAHGLAGFKLATVQFHSQNASYGLGGARDALVLFHL